MCVMDGDIPLDILDQIGRHCPRALTTYITCMVRASESEKITLMKEEIVYDLSESFVKFRNDLKSLAREGLLEWHQMGDHIHITLVDYV